MLARTRRLRRVVLVVWPAAALLAACGRAGPSTTAGSHPASSAPVASTSTSTTSRPTPLTTAPSAGGALTLLTEPADGYGFVSGAISGATTSIELAMYELSDTAVEQALVRAAGRGVRVEVLLDRNLERSNNQAAFTYLSAHGVDVHWGPGDVTLHEKTLCVDDDVCYVMTGNLTPQYYAATRDFVVVDRQGADVAAITTTFASDYGGDPPGPAPGGSDLVWSPGSEPDLVGLIDSAHEQLLVENEEMDNSVVVDALEQAARHGVHVVVVMTADSQWDQAFDQLSGAGVEVDTYADNAALYIHAKVVVADSSAAFVGSENFSTASMDYNRELGLITADPQLVSALTTQVQADATGGNRWPG